MRFDATESADDLGLTSASTKTTVVFVFEVRQTAIFSAWLKSLEDKTAARRIVQRIVRVQAGLLGDAKFFRGIGELRVDTGPGYRIYFIRRGQTIIILLCGGDKSTQRSDIARALAMAGDV